MSKSSYYITSVFLIIALIGAGSYIGPDVNINNWLPLVTPTAVAVAAFVFFASHYKGSNKDGNPKKKDDAKGNKSQK